MEVLLPRQLGTLEGGARGRALAPAVVGGVQPQCEVVQLAAHAQPVGQRLLLQVEVGVVGIESRGLVRLRLGGQAEEEAGRVLRELGSGTPRRPR